MNITNSVSDSSYDVYITSTNGDEISTIAACEDVDFVNVEVTLNGFEITVIQDDDEYSEAFPNDYDVKITLHDSDISNDSDDLLDGFEEVKIDSKEETESDEEDSVPAFCKNCFDDQVRDIVHQELDCHIDDIVRAIAKRLLSKREAYILEMLASLDKIAGDDKND